MARTQAGWELTRRHRLRQLAVRAEVLDDFTALWPVWEGDRDSFDRMLQAAVPLTQAGHRESARVGAGYYQAFRLAEGVEGEATPRLAGRLNSDRVVTSLYVTGTVAAERAIRAGRDRGHVMDLSRGMMSGAVGRHVMDGGRDTVMRSMEADPQGGRQRWQRVTGANPCAFCVTLSSRGPAYLSEQTADFEAHDWCACAVQPTFPGGEWNPQNIQHRETYEDAQQWARDTGEMPSGTSNDALNALRRFMNA